MLAGSYKHTYIHLSYLCVQLRRCHDGHSLCPFSKSGLKLRQVSWLHETRCVLSWSGGRAGGRGGGGNPFVAARLQDEDVSLIAMITWEARRCCCCCCWGFGVSLCILGMMGEMIQPKRAGCGRVGNCAPLRPRHENTPTNKRSCFFFFSDIHKCRMSIMHCGS